MYQSSLHLFFLFLVTSPAYAQQIPHTVQLSPGKTLTINMEIRSTMAQQAGTQAIDFSVNGGIVHYYTVTGSEAGNTTLHHGLKQFHFDFEGMGKKISFNSDLQKASSEPFVKQFEELLSKKYDMVIDSGGRTAAFISDTIKAIKQNDNHWTIVADMLKPLTDIAYPPQKEKAGFFDVLPPFEAGIGDSWTDSSRTDHVKSKTVHTLSAITDSTIVIDFKTTVVSTTRSEMMGMTATTHLKNTTAGTLILDRATGLLREKTYTTDSNGTTETRGSSLPITGKSHIKIVVQ